MLIERETVRVSLKRHLQCALAILSAAFMLLWPALLNRFPLLFPDEGQYLWDGRTVFRQLLGLSHPTLLEARSELYSVVVYVLYRALKPWIIVALQALLTSWVLWLTVRSVVHKRQIAKFLLLSAALSLCSGASWYVSFLMPDIFGPLLYLSFYLLVFASETLHRWERYALLGVAFFGITAHATHLVLAAWVCFALAILWLVGWSTMRHRGLWLSRVGMVVLLAAVAQITMHTVLYGEPSLFGKTPSFLTARLLGDGPARSYLQQHCAELDWVLCSHVGRLPVTEADFLWNPNGIWQTATPQQKQQLRQEEMPLVKATLNAYPLQQAKQSGINFLRMLGNVGPAAEFDANPVLSNRNVDPMIWRVNTGYLDSRQAHNQMPDGFFRHLDEAIVLASLGLLLFLLPRAWHRGLSPRLTGLSAIVLLVLPANAFLTGVFSGSYPRYQGRVVWLLILLVALLVCNMSDEGATAEQETMECKLSSAELKSTVGA